MAAKACSVGPGAPGWAGEEEPERDGEWVLCCIPWVYGVYRLYIPCVYLFMLLRVDDG